MPASMPIAWWRWPNMSGRKPMDLSRDVVFGHEFCCEVLDYGPATQRRLKPGTRVCSLPALVTPTGPAGIGYSNDNVGGYAERMLLSEPLLLEVPNGLVGRARGADRAARGRRPCGGQGQYQGRRSAAGDRLRSGRAGRDRGAPDQGPASDHRRRLFAGAAGAGRKDGRRCRGRSGPRAALCDLGRACRDVGGGEGGAAAVPGASCRR